MLSLPGGHSGNCREQLTLAHAGIPHNEDMRVATHRKLGSRCGATRAAKQTQQQGGLHCSSRNSNSRVFGLMFGL